MSTSWFEGLFGFPESSYRETQGRFALRDGVLTSRENGRSFGVGAFSTPSLAELRAAAAGLRPGKLRVRHQAIGDVLEVHALADNEGSLFQAASQLNCLEFADPRETPERGVTQYAFDPTQGPACSLAAAAATVVRNYFVEVDGQVGQTRDRQLNTLADLQAALGDAGELLEIRNGYSFSTPENLVALGQALDAHERDALMGHIRIGLHSPVEVTFATRFSPPAEPRFVSQAFCSALSCGYASGSLAQWRPIATLVLDAAYEATLLAAILEAEAGRGSGRVWLTLLGGGVFGNSKAWIAYAIRRALTLVADRALDIRIAHHRVVDEEMRELVDEG